VGGGRIVANKTTTKKLRAFSFTFSMRKTRLYQSNFNFGMPEFFLPFNLTVLILSNSVTKSQNVDKSNQ
jgi:hypothetical protein